MPRGGEAAPFAHAMRRLRGIPLESNDLLAHACLGIRLQLTYCVTHGAVRGAETCGELFPLSTTSVRPHPSLWRLFLLHMDLPLGNASEG